MSLIVKIMSGENLPDDDTRKTYRLLTSVEYFAPVRDENNWPVGVYLGFNRHHGIDGVDIGPEFFPAEGNVYVMNENGKTVSSFASAPAPKPPSQIHNGDEFALGSLPYDLAASMRRCAAILALLSKGELDLNADVCSLGLKNASILLEALDRQKVAVDAANYAVYA